jgi:hypothetical protein
LNFFTSSADKEVIEFAPVKKATPPASEALFSHCLLENFIFVTFGFKM